MATSEEIMAKLVEVEETKRLLKEALVKRGAVIEDTDAFRTYVDKIQALNLDKINCIEMP